MKTTFDNLNNLPTNSGIYLFTNLVNNKLYVGQAKNLSKRIHSHRTTFNHGGNKRMILYKAMLKYGIENFQIELIEEFEEYNPRQLDALEKYYIKYYNSKAPYGYNQTDGGDGGILGYKMTDEQKQVISQNSKNTARDGRYTMYCYNINTKETTTYLNCEEASEVLNINGDCIRGALCYKRLVNNTYLFYKNESDLQELLEFKQNVINNSNPDYLKIYYENIWNMYKSNNLPKMQEYAKQINLALETLKKRNKKLKELGYDNPWSKIQIINIHVKDLQSDFNKIMTVDECMDYFDTSRDSIIRVRTRNNSIYHKRYQFIFNIKYPEYKEWV